FKLKALKTPKRLPEFILEENIRRISQDQGYSADVEGQRDRIVLEFLYLTGVRLSELIQLTWGAIDYNNESIKVLGKRKKERVIPITPGLKRSLVVYQKAYEETIKNVDHLHYFIVNKHREPVYPMKIYRIVRKYLDLFAHTSKRSPHLLRHTFATHLLNKGADLNAVKDLLGHASLAATQVYTHNTMEKLKAVFDLAHPKA